MEDLRIGNEERELAISALSAHLIAGRLTPTEFESRAAQVTAAGVRGDLRPLFDDLPPPHPPFLAAVTLPAELRALLAAEGTLVLVEQAPGELVYRNYRTPSRHYWRRKVTVVGTAALTGRRLVVWLGDAKHVDVPFEHPLRAAVAVAASADQLRITADAGAFHPARSGSFEVRLRTTRAPVIARLWTQHQ